MSNLSLLISIPIGILSFLFLFWKRLKEDYPSHKIFSFAFLMLTFSLLGMFVGFSLHVKYPISQVFSTQGLWFWLAFLSATVTFIACFFHFKTRFFETLEATGLGLISLFFSVLLVSLIQYHSLIHLLFTLLTGLLLPLFFLLDMRYKSFSWYKSGKVGFAGLAILALFFLLRAIFALIDPAMLSFIGKLDAILDSIVSFLFFISLYNLSGL